MPSAVDEARRLFDLALDSPSSESTIFEALQAVETLVASTGDRAIPPKKPGSKTVFARQAYWNLHYMLEQLRPETIHSTSFITGSFPTWRPSEKDLKGNRYRR